MRVQDYSETDWPAVWAIVSEVLAEGDTYAYDPAMTADQARRLWVEPPPARTTVAVAAGAAPEGGAQILGTAKMGPNRPGPGAHIATASFMVAAAARGRGVGSTLCRDALDWARAEGYAGMQFNAVVETNAGAVELYKRLGFEIIGTVPGAFEHPRLGRVGLHIMYCAF